MPLFLRFFMKIPHNIPAGRGDRRHRCDRMSVSPAKILRTLVAKTWGEKLPS